MPSKIFISYRRDDSKYQARGVYDAFQKVLPRDNVFMDVDSIPPGADFVEILEGWVDKCEVLLALIGQGWASATDPKTGRRRLENPHDFVRVEVREALVRGIPVVPVLLDGTPMPDANELPDDIKKLVRRQAEFIEYRTFDADVARLVKKLQIGQNASEASEVNAKSPNARASVGVRAAPDARMTHATDRPNPPEHTRSDPLRIASVVGSKSSAVITAIVVGLVSGWLASVVVGGSGGLIRYLIVGLVGSLVGAFFGRLVMRDMVAGIWSYIATSIIGSIIVIIIARIIA
jgi:uncharacterized membrane protein YeaQ/YmgE (transglycosylase-associated protein family)